MKIRDLPREIVAKVEHMLGTDGADIELPTPTGWHILALQYVRPEKTRGGLYIADVTKQEDVYQGRVGMVLAVGPSAYADTAKFGTEPWCKPGDFIAWPPIEGTTGRTKYGPLVLAVIADDRVLMMGVDPEVAMRSN